jgi:hypothetical protein
MNKTTNDQHYFSKWHAGQSVSMAEKNAFGEKES